MSTLAVFRLPPAQSPLAAALSELPEVAVEAERVVTADPAVAMPFLWVVGEASLLERFESRLLTDPGVATAAVLTDLGDERLYAVEWVRGAFESLDHLVANGGTVLSARGDANGWRLRTLFTDHEGLSAAFAACRNAGIDVSVEAVHAPDDGAEHGRFGLTADQYATLVAAAERGYFDVPRGVSTEELAADLGITHQALSERLRRAQKALVRNALGVDTEETGGNDADDRVGAVEPPQADGGDDGDQ